MSVEETEWCWLNGQIVPLSEARISVEDRGFQFADGVYEVLHLYNGKPFALRQHLERLDNSCCGLKLSLPIDRESLAREMMKLVKHSGARDDAIVYLQLTRGPARRNHLHPKDPSPTLLFFVRKVPPVVPIDRQRGAKLLTVPDERWRKCWIKTTALVANLMARNEAQATGADEAVFVDEHGIVAECTSSNLFAVISGTVVTHPAGRRVLPGITRDAVIACAKSNGIPVEECPIHINQAKAAPEVFLTNTSGQVMWVKEWDGCKVGSGACGPVTRQLSELLDRAIQDDVADHIRGSSG